MSLQVWLPLNGDLHNQGLDQIVKNTSNSGAVINNNGKIGKCYSFDGADDWIQWSINKENYGNKPLSFCCWFKSDKSKSTGCIIDIAADLCLGYNYNSNNITFYYWRVYGTSSSRSGDNNTTTNSFDANLWHHIAAVYDDTTNKIYVDGILQNTWQSKSQAYWVPLLAASYNKLSIGKSAGSTSWIGGLVNDVRIYDHALSDKEVEEISKGLVLHYQLNNNGLDNPNLFRGTIMRPIDRTNFVSSSSTDWTKYLRYYNGNTSIHTFTEEDGIYIDTIKLNSTANLGICFGRLASEINLDSSSYYTISCEAKCTKAGAGIDIGLSYLTTSDSWVWRGGSNRKLFNNTTDWQFFTHTFKPDSDTKAIDYCFTVVGVSSGTDTLSIRKCKLEKGSVATFWSPAPEDLGIDSSIIYDSSGYNHNGTITGQLEIAQPSPKFNCATYMNNISTSNHIECNNEIILPIDNITVSLWVKANKSTNQVIFASPQIEFGILNNLGYCNPNGNQAGWTLNNFITNEWNHIVIIRQNSTYKLYINNILETQNGAQNNYNHNKNVLWLLNRGNNNTYAGNASISDFRIYATALTAAQVKNLYRTSMIVDGTAVRPRDLE